MQTLSKLRISATFLLTAAGVAVGQQYKQTNLVASTSGVAPVTDPSLVNPWGISRSPGGAWWVSDNGTGLSTLYNGPGAKQGLVVKIPKADPTSKTFPAGTPTGTIFNGSATDFLLAPGKPAAFLFSTIDGSIAAWNPAVGIAAGAAAPSTTAITVIKTTDGSSYTGLTSALVSGERFLYVANYGKDRIDIFDNTFHAVSAKQLSVETEKFEENLERQSAPFTDDRLPRNFVPFNIQAIGNDLVVTYAMHPQGTPGPEIDGPGLGYIDLYSSTGRLIRRFEHGDWLNAPWGVALAPLDFGRYSHDLLVGQFGGGGTSESGGYIAAYDLATGKLDGLLQDATGKPLVVPGVWGLSFGNAAPGNADPAAAPASELYFAAGPNGGAAGLFGYISPVSTDLVQGNDQ